ncbi:hypothetical protein EDD11_009755 [Mortierella claussenii]|nr:hypothetical protein EDD11_009755 [Mortierella claussenii]
MTNTALTRMTGVCTITTWTARYFQERLGDFDPEKPHLRPLRKMKAGTDMLRDYYMPETVDFYIKAVVDLWTEQAHTAPNGV